MQAVRELVYVRTDAIGDAVLSAGILPALKSRFGGAVITVVCQEHVKPFYEACRHIDHIIGFDEKLVRQDENRRNEVVNLIAARNPELVINPVYSPCVHTHLFSIGNNTAYRVGFHGDSANIQADQQKYFEQFYSLLVPGDGARTEIERNSRFLAALGLGQEAVGPMFWTVPADEEAVDGLLKAEGLDGHPLVAIFSSGQSASRSCDVLGKAVLWSGVERGACLIALGAAKDFETNEINCRESGRRYLNLSGRLTLRQSAAVLRRCLLAVGVETSLCHIACALGVRNVAVAGGGDFGRFLPYSPLTSLVILPLECYQCNWHCRYSVPVCVRDVLAEAIGDAVKVSHESQALKPRVFIQKRPAPRKITSTAYPAVLGGDAVARWTDAEIIELEW